MKLTGATLQYTWAGLMITFAGFPALLGERGSATTYP
jgi:hypothetical protein